MAAEQPTKNLAPEDPRKAVSRKRIYWTIVLIDILIGALFVYEVIDLFAK
jgi:hypothetical protein